MESIFGVKKTEAHRPPLPRPVMDESLNLEKPSCSSCGGELIPAPVGDAYEYVCKKCGEVNSEPMDYWGSIKFEDPGWEPAIPSSSPDPLSLPTSEYKLKEMEAFLEARYSLGEPFAIVVKRLRRHGLIGGEVLKWKSSGRVLKRCERCGEVKWIYRTQSICGDCAKERKRAYMREYMRMRARAGSHRKQ